MVDLVDVQARANSRCDQPVHVFAGARQGLVVVAGFLQDVAGVAGHDVAVLVPAQDRELGLQAGEESQAFFLEQGHLFFQHHAAVVFPGLAVHMAIADDAGKAGLPGNQAHGTEVTARHEVGSVRLDTQAPDRKAGKTRAGVQHLIKMRDRYRLGFGCAMDVDKLRQHIAHVVVFKKFLSLVAIHRVSPYGLGAKGRGASDRISGRRTQAQAAATLRHLGQRVP